MKREILKNNKMKVESKNIFELIPKNLELIRNGYIKQNNIKTGFSAFDRAASNSLLLGEFVFVGSARGNGRTQFLTTLSLNISKTTPILFFSLDFSAEYLTTRFISSLTGIPTHTILENKLSLEENQLLSKVDKQIATLKMHICDKGDISFAELKKHCQQQIEENGIKVILIDNLPLLSSKKNPNEKYSEISYVSKQLKSFAVQYNVCVIASGILENTLDPTQRIVDQLYCNLQEIGRIEQSSDKILFTYRPEYYCIEKDEMGNDTKDLVEIIIAKNRNGSLDIIKLKKDRYSTTLIDY